MNDDMCAFFLLRHHRRRHGHTSLDVLVPGDSCDSFKEMRHKNAFFMRSIKSELIIVA